MKSMRTKLKSGRTLSMLWLLLIVVAILLGNLTGFTRNTSISDGTSTPYRVSITTSNFRISQLSASADDVSNPQRVMFHLQNGTSLWYGISVTSTPAGIVPVAATPSDIVSSTFSGSFSLLPPAQVLPSDQWNGVYHFQTLQLGISFSGPGQQFQLTLSPTEPHAVTLDVITLLLHLLGLHNEGTQIGLLENGQLANIFITESGMKDFETLVQDYSQILTNGANATQTLASAYACALDISNLLSDNSEQAALADLLWHIQGKAVSRDNILHTITSFSQSQFGLAVEGFIKGQAATFAPMLASTDSPTVQLQTISNIVTSPTPAISPTHSATSTTSTLSKHPVTSTPTPHSTPTKTPVITSTPIK